MGATVCLVDDDDSVRRAVSRLLRSAGLQVLAYDSAEAFLAAGPLPAGVCLVLDIHLPSASGIDLHLRFPSIPAVFITAVDDDQTRELAAKGQLLLKPFEAERLLEAIEQALAQPPGG